MGKKGKKQKCFKLVSCRIEKNGNGKNMAFVSVDRSGRVFKTMGEDQDIIKAVFKGVVHSIFVPHKLEKISVKTVLTDTGKQMRVGLEVTCETYSGAVEGKGAHHQKHMAAAFAAIDAVNQLHSPSILQA